MNIAPIPVGIINKTEYIRYVFYNTKNNAWSYNNLVNFTTPTNAFCHSPDDNLYIRCYIKIFIDDIIHNQSKIELCLIHIHH